MMEVNTDKADKYFHCVSHCQAAQHGTVGAAAAGYGGYLRELYGQVKGDPLWDAVLDMRANIQGLVRGYQNPTASCLGAAGLCSDYRPVKLRNNNSDY